jgi:hypothetical protein
MREVSLMSKKVAWLCFLLGSSLGSLLVGCAGREIYYVRGCDERLAIAYKRMECRACVERPRPRVFLPDNPDGARCAPR